MFYTIIPMHGLYSVTMWKDVLFATSVLLLTIQCYKMLQKKEITIKNSWGFILISLLTIFLRNNAIYAYIILVIASFVVFKKNYKQLLTIFLIIFASVFIIKGPIYKILNVIPSESAEYISIPLQQVGRMAYKDVKFTKEEQDLINKLMPVDVLKEVYDPGCVDSIKLNTYYNAKYFDTHKSAYFKLWLNLSIKHFGIASEAYLTSTLGYYYPGLDNWTYTFEVYENNYDLKESSLLPKLKSFFIMIASKKIPFLSIVWSIGLVFFMILIAMYITKIRLGKKYLFCFMPIVGLWLTLMIASPVYGEFRYIYGAYTTLPFLLILPFLKGRVK